MPQDRHGLPEGTVLDNYRVLNLIGSGGFSLIYLAEDADTGEEVVIKEFMPKKFARRDSRLLVQPDSESARDNLNRSLRLFFQEAKVLAGLRHPNIVQVLGFFRHNNTGYIVMEYYRGQNLASYIKRRQGLLSTNFILRVFIPILDALSLIHSKALLHLDIKPGNIQLRAGSEPLLLDFGAVNAYSADKKSKGGQVITAGYSPVEQYYQSGNLGPWSDVYAIGASIRACMQGKTPPSSVERHAGETLVAAVDQFRGQYPLFLLEAVDWSMQMNPQARPQDAGELLKILRDNADLRAMEPSTTSAPGG